MDAQVLHLTKLWRAGVRLASPFTPQWRNAACEQVPITPPSFLWITSVALRGRPLPG